MAEAATQCEPVFVTARALPSHHVLPDTIDMCSAAERVSGRGSIRGAQRIRGLWRIYPRRKEARDILLLKGMELWGTQITLHDKNPFLVKDNEKPATKLWISNIPLSVDDKVVETTLTKMGCEMRSSMRKELARNKEGKLTNWETGRRFVFISIPESPLPNVFQTGIFTGELYYKEVKEQRKREAGRGTKCANCLLPDHTAAVCTSPVVCLACLKPGHKRADCDAPLSVTVTNPNQTQQEPETTTIAFTPSQIPPPPITQDPEIIPPTQDVYDTAKSNTQETREARKKKKAVASHVTACPARETSAKRHRLRGSSSEREEEQHVKRPAAEKQVRAGRQENTPAPDDQEMSEHTEEAG